MGEKLFGEDFHQFNQSDFQSEMLKTIRIPKNLLYLTDRLPKPHYDESPHKNKAHANSVIIKSNKKEQLERDESTLRSEQRAPKR